MESNQEVQEMSNLSPDPRVRVFRRIIKGLDEFEGMGVDAYAVLGENYVVLLDTLLCPADMEQVVSAITPDLIEKHLVVVNSHADWDHTWGNGYFRSMRESVSLLAHERCRQRMLSPEARQDLEEYQARYPVFHNVVLEPPTMTFPERFSIHDPQWTLELLPAPGHCRDHIAAWIPEMRILLAFDAIEKPLPSIEDATCVPLMFTTLESLILLNASTVLCSHGGTTSPTLLQENLSYLREIERRSRLFLERRTPTELELEQAAKLINYPFEEVLARIDEEVDQNYYRWAHNKNARDILQWLISVS